MVIAPAEGSFGSAARACAASSGVRGSTSAGLDDGRGDSVCVGADASGVVGAILSSDGEISFKGCSAGGLIAGVVSAVRAGKAKAAATKATPSVRMVLMLFFIIHLQSRPSVKSNGLATGIILRLLYQWDIFALLGCIMLTRLPSVSKNET